MDKHTDHHFDDALGELKRQIRVMGEKVESMLTDVVLAHRTRDAHLAAQLAERDHAINALEVSIDEQCIRLLVRYQPAASDLRFITRGLKIVTDLERVGDLVVNIANRVQEIVREGDHTSVDFTALSEVAQGMLRDAIVAFVDVNTALAESVLQRDDAVDDLTTKHVTGLLDRLGSEPEHVRRLFPEASIVRYLERIADHATNIAEQAIYAALGQDVRHNLPR